ncbi:M24 family metallopeptidase [Corynebacterium pseudotuberculosis]|uniref:M24 family metallopeptidase n=1 Tax=Corynebacterium pseudotuberculosis (strain C231) TaxID=681645 RepID=D9QAC7_CORP2|nr:Xaa-Pro peptidase family protein [Corynebacterium pseudotuberculosis]ADK28824.1 M24 family metallopeptidase [Corynebacterium pseudotuberculosis FRC41]ADL10503.1 M24 family metallopeptidase [Corynebacterium pseudotuberculosis C231]ADL20912.1 aminopeptidase P family protein [Corynebacterium pseudotuberculosis 1002]ADO26300.1 M24 family metallopeptidase [Corynebacterium pseudotuberculosis I19]AEK92361.1 Dipeptidase pepE [Corynebacterium pseudotuberculosis PAT10]
MDINEHCGFAPEVYSHRITRAAALARESGLSGLIIGAGAQLAYLTGSWISTHERLTALVIPSSGAQPTLIVPDVDRGDLRKSAIPSLDINILGWIDGQDPYAASVAALGASPHAAVGIGEDLTANHLISIQNILGEQTTTVLATAVLAELFIAKDAEEIDQLRSAGRAIDKVHAQVPFLLQPGRTEAEVAEDLAVLIKKDHSKVDFVIVGSQANGANPHHDYSDRKLVPGDLVVVDIGGTYGAGYHSDCTRTYVVGGDLDLLDVEARQMYTVLFRAQEEAVKSIKPGVTAASIDKVARDIISEAGYGNAFIHRTGHGIGLSTHEEPFIMKGNNLVLQPGMAFSVEPGIYLEDRFGARIEDIVVVTENGCERLNNQPRTLQ